MKSDGIFSPKGHPRLVNALAKLYGGLTERTINPNTEVLVTVGAYEALFCVFMGLVNPGESGFGCRLPSYDLPLEMRRIHRNE